MFEAVGAVGLIAQAVSLVRFRGRVVVAGVCVAPDSLQPVAAMMKEASLHFVLAYEKDDFQYAIDMIEQERIEPARMITGRVGLDGVPEAFDSLARGEECKVLVGPAWDEP